MVDRRTIFRSSLAVAAGVGAVFGVYDRLVNRHEVMYSAGYAAGVTWRDLGYAETLIESLNPNSKILSVVGFTVRAGLFIPYGPATFVGGFLGNAAASIVVDVSAGLQHAQNNEPRRQFAKLSAISSGEGSPFRLSAFFQDKPSTIQAAFAGYKIMEANAGSSGAPALPVRRIPSAKIAEAAKATV